MKKILILPILIILSIISVNGVFAQVTDTDGDGIPDSLDQCPTEPETVNGYQDSNGCPDEIPTNPDIVTIRPAQGSGAPGCEETIDGCYIPKTARVIVGGKVIFSNTDTAAHTFTAGTSQNGPSGIFDSSLILAGNSYEWIPTTEDEFPYYCMVHPWMSGMISTIPPVLPKSPLQPIIDAIKAIQNSIKALQNSITQIGKNLNMESQARINMTKKLLANDTNLQTQINNIELIPGPKGDPGTPAKIVHLEPVTCGPPEERNGISALIGWCPDGSGTQFYFIEDSDVKETSVVAITLDYLDGNYGSSCSVTHLTEGEGFLLHCLSTTGSNFTPVRPGTALNYTILNP